MPFQTGSMIRTPVCMLLLWWLNLHILTVVNVCNLNVHGSMVRVLLLRWQNVFDLLQHLRWDVHWLDLRARSQGAQAAPTPRHMLHRDRCAQDNLT